MEVSEIELLNTFWNNYNYSRTSSSSANEESIWLELFLFHVKKSHRDSVKDFELRFLEGSSLIQVLSKIYIDFSNDPSDFARTIRTSDLAILIDEITTIKEIDEIFALAVVRNLSTLSDIDISDIEYLIEFPIICPSISLLNSSSDLLSQDTVIDVILKKKTIRKSDILCAVKPGNVRDYLTEEFKQFSVRQIDRKAEFLLTLRMLQTILTLDKNLNCIFTCECLSVCSSFVTNDRNSNNTITELIWIDVLSMILHNIYKNEICQSHKIEMKNVVLSLISKHLDSGQGTSIFYYSYHLFTILNNTFFRENMRQDQKNEFDELFVEIESRKQGFLEIYRRLTENNPEMSAKLINLWIEIYVNFKEVEVKHIKSLIASQPSVKTRKIPQYHHWTKNLSYRKFICFLECLLLHVLPFCIKRHKMEILAILKNLDICCCNCGRWSIKIMLDLASNEAISQEILTFARRQIISTMYRNNYCRLCFEKTTSPFADDDFVNMHRNANQSISEKFFFPYISKLRNLLPFSIQSRLLMDILWPFYIEKINKSSENSDKVEFVLRTLCDYLQDPLLIKIFLNSETLERLKNMTIIPKASRYAYSIFLNALIHLSKVELSNKADKEVMMCKITEIFVKNTKNSYQVLMIYMRKILGCDKINFTDDLSENPTFDLLRSKSASMADVLDGALYAWRSVWNLLKNDLFGFEQYFLTNFFDLRDIFHFAQILLTFLLDVCKHSGDSKSHEIRSKIVLVSPKNQFDLEDDTLSFYSESTDLSLDSSNSHERSSILAVTYDLNFQRVSSKMSLNHERFYAKSDFDTKYSNHKAENYDFSRNKNPSDDPTMFDKFNNFLHNSILGFVYNNTSRNAQQNIYEKFENQLFNTSDVQMPISEDFRQRFWEIFEAILGTFVAALYTSDVEHKMLPALMELKKIILQHSQECTNIPESAKAIVCALEMILCAGDVSFMCNRSSSVQELCDEDFQTPTHSVDLDLCEIEGGQSDDDNASSYRTAEDCPDSGKTDSEMRDSSPCESSISSKFVRSESFPVDNNVVVNNNILRIVVEVLFEISTLCIENPSIWETDLIRLFTRLRSVQHLNQLTTCIIKGFTTLLQSNDNRLLQIQKSILELVENLNSPDALMAYMQLFTSVEPPVDLLLSQLHNLATMDRDINPLMEINFPTVRDELFRDPVIYDSMQLLKTRSPIVASFDSIEFTPWRAQGFTVSLWIKSSGISKYEKLNYKQSIYQKLIQNATHLFSVGSSKLVFSVYLDNKDSGLIHIQLIKPNKCGPDDRKTRPNCPPAMQSMLMLTKTALRSNWNFGNLVNKDDQRDHGDCCTSIPIQLKIPENRWSFLTFIVIPTDQDISVNIGLNCKETLNVRMPFNMSKATKNSNINILTVGDSNFGQQKCQGIKYSLTNLMLFTEAIPGSSIFNHLMALGPNCNNLISSQIGNTIPNFGLFNVKPFTENVNVAEAIKILREHLLLSYSAEHPNYATEFYTNYSLGTPIEVLENSNVIHAIKNDSFYSALVQIGGLSTLLYLFARIVEISDCSRLQATALKILLQIAHSSVELYTEFIKGEYLNTIGSIIKTTKCCKDLHLLQCFMDVAFDSPVLVEHFDGSFGLTLNHSYLIYPELVIFIISNYKDWYSDDGEVLETTLMIIKSLTTKSTKDMNIKRLMSVDLLPNLINFCKIYFVGASPPSNITPKSAKLIVDILAGCGPTPPSISFIDEIAKLLLLLHEPSYTYITQDRANYYYLLSKTTPSSPKFNQHIARTAERLKTKFHFQRKRNYSPHTTLRRRMRSISMDCLCPNSPRLSDQEFDFQGVQENKENFSETLAEIADVSKYDNRINKVSVRDATKLGKNLQIDRILKNKRILRKSISYNKNYEEVKTKSTFIPQPINNQMQISFCATGKSNENLIVLQKELLGLMQNFIIIMPDSLIVDVITHYVTFHLILILANNPNGDVRAEVVKLLSNLCDRMPHDKLMQYSKSYYFHHFANQISIYPANYALTMACQRLAMCGATSLSNYESIYPTINDSGKYKLRIGVVLMISILPRLFPSHHQSLKSSLLLLCNIYEKHDDIRSFMVESGLVPSLLKCIIVLYAKETSVDFTKGIANHILFTTYYLAKMFLTSNDYRHFASLLNYMDFVEEESCSLVVVQGIRGTQARILNGLLNACREKYDGMFLGNSMTVRSVIFIKGCNMSMVDMKSKFQYLMERSIMFLQRKDSTYELLCEENELVRTVINLGLIGRIKIGSIIIWSLCPSRGVDLKFFIIRCLTQLMKSKHVITFGFNISMIRTLANHFYAVVSGMPAFVSTSKFIMLSKFVKFIGGSSTNADIEKATARIDEICGDICKHQIIEMERTVHEFEPIALSCVETSLKVTRTYSELQNTERRNLLNQMRCENTDNFNWKFFISQMTHEGAPFFNERYNPKSCELDDTEGPSRTRLRFRRCNVSVPERFYLPEAREKYKDLNAERPLQYLVDSVKREKNALSDQVLYNFSAAYITADSEFFGDLVVTETVIKFFPDDEKREIIMIEIANVLDIWLRRYMHQNRAVELFMLSGKSLFFVLREVNDRKIFAKYFSDKICDSSNTKWHYFMLQQWRDGQLTNWEYLTALNQLSGRSYQDVMQYPVFPWILSDYQSNVLDLTNPNIYRKLEKPIAIQHKDSEEHFREMFEYLSQPGNRNVSHFAYHYSSHYSNSGTVLSFMIRVPPFTSMFIKYQDNNFDLPDRTFFSVRHAWRLASKDSQTDVKELIPEFFTLPEMFENNEDFNFGLRQSGERVHNVTLPPWSNNSARLFVLIHRQALESDYVRSRLHFWIDLIFGYKQTGKAAVAAMNVFHSATYPDFSEPTSTDPVDRSAYATMIKTYGQMPKQIIVFPHPPAVIEKETQEVQTSFATYTVKGLKWGIYTGSPQLSMPECVAIYQQCDVTLNKIICMDTTNTVYGLAPFENYMQGIEIDTFYCVTWKHEDNIVRIRSIGEDVMGAKPLFQTSNFDPITSCGTNTGSNQLWFGYRSGRIVVYQCSDFVPEKLNKTRFMQHSPLANTMSYNSAFRMCKSSGAIGRKLNESITRQIRDVGSLKWKKPVTLIFHEDEVTGISICVEFKVAVSIGRDGKTAIWDTNTLEFVRQIQPPNTSNILPLTLAAVSPTLGDIATIHCSQEDIFPGTEIEVDEESYEVTESNIDDFVKISMNLTGKTLLRVHTINGSYVSHVTLNENILSLSYSNVKEGTGINVIATGLERGIVKLWSSWDLNLIREIDTQMNDVIDLAYSTYQHLIVLTKDNIIQVWESPCLLGNAPKFPQSIFRNNQWRIL
ncbi:hypothetical protein DMENIID0001_134480 [Sergentomyia squamirostris]